MKKGTKGKGVEKFERICYGKKCKHDMAGIDRN